MDFLVANFAEILFYCLAVLTVAGGVGVLIFKSPVHAALSLLFTFVMVGALMGGAIWLAGGLLAIGLVSAAICGVALAWLAWGLRNWRD